MLRNDNFICYTKTNIYENAFFPHTKASKCLTVKNVKKSYLHLWFEDQTYSFVQGKNKTNKFPLLLQEGLMQN